MTLELRDVSVKIGAKNIIEKADLIVPDKKFVGLVGLNGTGKSTLLKAVYGINPYSGAIVLNGKNIKEFSLQELAREIAVLVQENSNDFDFKVYDIVMLGRLPYKKLFDDDTQEDHDCVDRALRYVNMQNFKDRYFNTLSGGEKQRVLIARILAQQTDFLILDEPTNHLDVKNQFNFFELLKGLNMTVFAVLHDLNIAAKFCDYVYVLHEGKICASGNPAQVFNRALLEKVFGMRAAVYKTADGRFFIEYLKTVSNNEAADNN